MHPIDEPPENRAGHGVKILQGRKLKCPFGHHAAEQFKNRLLEVEALLGHHGMQFPSCGSREAP
jgi:hypothetical protein